MVSRLQRPQNNAPLSLPRASDVIGPTLPAYQRRSPGQPFPPSTDPSSPPSKARTREKPEPWRLPHPRPDNLLHCPLGKTALHWAAAVNNARAARCLLQTGADKDAQDNRVRPDRAPHTHTKRGAGEMKARGKTAKSEGGGTSGPAGGVGKELVLWAGPSLTRPLTFSP